MEPFLTILLHRYVDALRIEVSMLSQHASDAGTYLRIEQLLS